MALVLTLLLCGCGTEEEDTLPTGGAVQPLTKPEVTGYVALTFDDGPTPKHTVRLLDGLKARDAQATFFLAGYRLEGNEELVRRMRREGHQIGNHTYRHAQLTTLTTVEALADLAACDLALCTLLGEGEYWVRPPYGSIGGEVCSRLDVPVVCWSVDPLDWTDDDADRVAEHILDTVKDGDIILLHDCYSSTVDAALRVVDGLRARGMQLVTVARLLEVKGVAAQGGGIYYRAG